MLKNIYIRHFAIIDELNLPVQSGMSVITGETGAGKSIILEAIELALGKRVSVDVVAKGKERSDIELDFDISHVLALKSLLAHYELANDNQCVLRRSIYKDGRTKSFINDIPVTLNTLKEVRTYLVNIHGQHEFQTLLQPKLQRQLLDRYANIDELTEKINACYERFKVAQKAESDFLEKMKNSDEKSHYLRYQLDELEALNLKVGESEQLTKEHRLLLRADDLVGQLESSLTAFNDPDHSLLTILQNNIKQLSLYRDLDQGIENIVALLESADVELQEAESELQHYLSQIEHDAARLHFLEERLSKIHELSRKHQVTAEQLPQLQQKIEEELADLSVSDERLAQLTLQLQKTKKVYFEKAKLLHQKREKAAAKLSKEVSESLASMNMEGALFVAKVIWQDDNVPKINGMDDVMFEVALNVGSSLQPLAKVASGGELSRISLAICALTTQNMALPTLIFDEVDSGIGGQTAIAVGELLHQLSQNAQTICVTHLAQVASKGDHHLFVEKGVQAKKTVGSITYLNEEDRIQELARMIAGNKITKDALAHAKGMLYSDPS